MLWYLREQAIALYGFKPDLEWTWCILKISAKTAIIIMQKQAYITQTNAFLPSDNP